jgi:hypothetical protein
MCKGNSVAYVYLATPRKRRLYKRMLRASYGTMAKEALDALEAGQAVDNRVNRVLTIIDYAA